MKLVCKWILVKTSEGKIVLRNIHEWLLLLIFKCCFVLFCRYLHFCCNTVFESMSTPWYIIQRYFLKLQIIFQRSYSDCSKFLFIFSQFMVVIMDILLTVQTLFNGWENRILKEGNQMEIRLWRISVNCNFSTSQHFTEQQYMSTEQIHTWKTVDGIYKKSRNCIVDIKF